MGTPEFKIKFQEKASYIEDKYYYTFWVEINDPVYKNVKVHKLLSDFDKLERIVLESTHKQSLFFNDGT